MKQKTSMTTQNPPKAGRHRHAGSPSAKPDACAYQTQPPERAATSRERKEATPGDGHASPRRCNPKGSPKNFPDGIRRHTNPRRNKAAGGGTLAKSSTIPSRDSSRRGDRGGKSTNRVLVANTTKTAAMPCHPARARQLLKAGKAAVLRTYPFTIVLKHTTQETQPTPIKIDPGAKTAGNAIVTAKKEW